MVAMNEFSHKKLLWYMCPNDTGSFPKKSV